MLNLVIRRRQSGGGLRSPRPRGAARSAQAGMSLIEVLIAAAILLIIAVGILPLFTRAMLNNISGFDSNEASHIVRSEQEDLLSLSVDDPIFDMRNPQPGFTVQESSVGDGGEELLMTDNFLDPAGRAVFSPTGPAPSCVVIDGSQAKSVAGSADCVKLGDAGWIDDADNAKGLVIWQRRPIIRNYTYADISEGVIDRTGTQLVTLGNALMFDRPLLSTDPATATHYREQTIELKNERAGNDATLQPAQLQQTTMPLGPGSQRTRIIRTF